MARCYISKKRKSARIIVTIFISLFSNFLSAQNSTLDGLYVNTQFDTIRIAGDRLFYKSFDENIHIGYSICFESSIVERGKDYIKISSANPIESLRKNMRIQYENNQNMNDSISLKISLSRLRIGDTIEFDLIIGCDTIKKQISETLSSPCSYVKYKLDDCIQIGNIHYLVRDFARDESVLPYYVASTHLRNIQGYLKLDTKGFNVINIDLNYAINLLESHYSKGEYIVVQDGKVVIWKNQIFKRIINREPLEIKPFIYSLFLSS